MSNPTPNHEFISTPIEDILRHGRQDPEAAVQRYKGKRITFQAEAANIYTWPNKVTRLDTWYSYPEGRLTVRANVALIFTPDIDTSWIEIGQHLLITAQIVQMDFLSLGTIGITVEPV